MIDPNTALYSLEVGQGAAAAIVEPYPGFPDVNQATILDVGESGTRLAEWLKTVGVERIIAVILTHNDSDHIGSLAQLVHAYQGKIGKLWFVVDRRRAPSFWIPAAKWEADGWVNEINIINAPLSSRPSPGGLVLGSHDECSFRLYCAYPPTVGLFDRLVDWLPAPLRKLFGGPNTFSAVLRLTPADAHRPSHAIVGGDLDYRSWQYLVGIKRDLSCEVFLVPHHGGPQRKTRNFGPQELVAATMPKVAIVSVGTGNHYGLPHEDLIRAFRTAGSAVLCTQITRQCLSSAISPDSLPGQAVLPRLSNAPRLCSSGSACAGSVAVTFPQNGPDVQRFTDHQSEVNKLQTLGHAPLCRR